MTAKVKKKSSKKNTPKKNTPKKKSKNNNELIIEISSILAIGISILIIISVFKQNASGTFGIFISQLLKGLFGFGAYIIPFIIIAICFYMILNKNKNIETPRLTMGIILFLLIISIIHTFSVDENVKFSTFSEYLSNSYEIGNFNNGGLFGAIIGDGLTKIIGKIGTYIVFIISSIILVIFITKKSIYKFMLEIIQRYKEFLNNTDISDEDNDDIDTIDEPYEEKKIVKRPIKKPPEKIKEEKTNIILPLLEKPISRNKNKIISVEIKKNEPIREKHKITLMTDEIRKKREIDGIPSFLLERTNAINEDIKDDKNIDLIKDKEPIIHNISEEFEEIESNSDYDIPTKDINKLTASDNSEPIIIQAEISKQSSDIDINNDNEEYKFPLLKFLNKNVSIQVQSSKSEILENSKKLENTLKSFGVEAKVVEISKGPTVTRYELSPGLGVKVSKISALADDLALNLAASGIRIEAPIPGKSAVGIEVPNKEPLNVYLHEVISDPKFRKFPSKLAFGLGKDIAGNVIVADIAKMPHMLIAGATGSGKSVCINTLITSILYKATPQEVKLIMVDPKVVELSVYNGIPHLMIPVVTDPKKAAGALNWAVQEMMKRYSLFAETGVRNLKGYNDFKLLNGEKEFFPQIIIIIDELADLMMVASKEVEDSICRLAQLARAAGIHLIIATQRPSVDVITGIIKANIPSRIAFSVSSGTDSRTIIDTVGAEKLIGKGDMLFKSVDMSKPLRVQGSFISDKEVENIVNYIKKDNITEYDSDMIDKITNTINNIEKNEDKNSDEFTDKAIEFVVNKGKASVSMLQRQFRIGYNRAARIIEELEERGIVGPEDGSKARTVIMTKYEFIDYNTRHNNLL